MDPIFKQEDRKSALNSQLVSLMVMHPRRRTLDKKMAEMEVKCVDMEVKDEKIFWMLPFRTFYGLHHNMCETP